MLPADDLMVPLAPDVPPTNAFVNFVPASPMPTMMPVDAAGLRSIEMMITAIKKYMTKSFTVSHLSIFSIVAIHFNDSYLTDDDYLRLPSVK